MNDSEDAPPGRDGGPASDDERGEENGRRWDAGGEIGENPTAPGNAAAPPSEDDRGGHQLGTEGGQRVTIIRIETTVADGAAVEQVDAVGIYQAFQNTFFGANGESVPRSRDLTERDFTDLLDRDRLRACGEGCFVSPEDLDAVVACLRRNRLVFVVGDDGLGKGELCQAAAGRIAGEDSSVQAALIVNAVDRGLRLRPEHLLERGEMSGRILLFERAFHGGNDDLVRLAEHLDGPRVESLRRRFEARGSYLLLTSDAQRFPGSLERLGELGALVRIAPPRPAILLAILRHHVHSRTGEGQDRPLSKAAQEIVLERGEWLIDRLGTVPRMRRWVEGFLEPVARGELTPEESLERLEGTERWLLGDLPADLPVWSFVLALALASTHSRTRWVPWLSFHRLWREIEAVVARELGCDPESSGESDPVRRLVVDARFLGVAKAEVRRLPYPAGDGVRFRDPATAEQVWSVLLGPGRSLLSALRPRLSEVARFRDRVAVLANRALGRLGELEPVGVTQAEIDEGLGRKAAGSRYAGALLVGELVLGAFGSDDPSYRSGTLSRLRAATGGPAVERAEAAIVAFVPLAAVLPNRILEVLWDVLCSRVREKAEAKTPLGRVVRERLDRLARTKQPPRTGGPVVLGPAEAEDAALEVLGLRAGRLLDAFQFALVGLCFGGEIVAVAVAMARWLRAGGEVAPWLAFLVLRSQGVLRILERVPVGATDGEEIDAGEQPLCSRILLAADDEDRIAAVVELLEAAHAAVAGFPGTLRTWLRSNLERVLDGWMEQATRTAIVRERTVRIFSLLLEVADDALRREVFTLVQRRSTGAESRLRDLAREVLRAGMPGGTPHGTAVS